MLFLCFVQLSANELRSELRQLQATRERERWQHQRVQAELEAAEAAAAMAPQAQACGGGVVIRRRGGTETAAVDGTLWGTNDTQRRMGSPVRCRRSSQRRRLPLLWPQNAWRRWRR